MFCAADRRISRRKRKLVRSRGAPRLGRSDAHNTTAGRITAAAPKLLAASPTFASNDGNPAVATQNQINATICSAAKCLFDCVPLPPIRFAKHVLETLPRQIPQRCQPGLSLQHPTRLQRPERRDRSDCHQNKGDESHKSGIHQTRWQHRWKTRMRVARALGSPTMGRARGRLPKKIFDEAYRCAFRAASGSVSNPLQRG